MTFFKFNGAPKRWRNVCLLSGALALLPFDLLAGPKPVMVHYMPWFVAAPFGGAWGWHWTMNHFNPGSTNANGQREIASWYYPQIGPYDSNDPAVLEYQTLLMKLAGVDGVIVDWYGMDNYVDYGVNNQRTLSLFNWTRRAGLKFCLCYEDATIKNEINGGFIAGSEAIVHAQQTMLYMETNFFDDPSYLRLREHPVLLNFGPRFFTVSSNWSSIFSVLNASNAPAFFTEDEKLDAGWGAFDWPPMALSRTNGGVLAISQLNAYLAQFEQKATGWPAYISSAFPRFHDVYGRAAAEPSLGKLDDDNGATFQSTLRRAITNTSAIVQIVTWNDYGEGTVIEPTAEYGHRDLGVLQDIRGKYLSPGYAGTTNDFSLALRLYNARRCYSGNAVASAEMDRIFSEAVAGNLANAKLKLSKLETLSPAALMSVTNSHINVPGATN